VQDRRGPAAVTGDEGREKPLPESWREGAAGGRSGSQKTCPRSVVDASRVVHGATATRAAASKTGGPGQTKCLPGLQSLKGKRKGGVMQAVVIREVGGFELADVPAPEPGPGEALVRVSVTGLCRTDLKVVRHGHRDLTLPRVPGEEVVGQVVALGDPDEGPFAPGDRVYVYPGVWCGECPSCRRGAENLCRQMRIMGFHRDGGFAEYVAAPLQSLIRVPEGLVDEEAVFAEPLSCCLNALELGRVGEGDVLGVWGAGPAGTLLSRAGALRGAEVIVVEPDEHRRDFLVSAPGAPPQVSGHESAPVPLDVAVVAVGDPAAYEAAIAALAPRGRLVVFSGLLPADDAELHVSLSAVHYHEHTFVGAYGCSFRHGVEALDLLASGRLRVDDLISHRLPLADLDEGLDLVARRAGMKVHLYPSSRPAIQ
jgi:L-iditol 2-dehydrogenase